MRSIASFLVLTGALFIILLSYQVNGQGQSTENTMLAQPSYTGVFAERTRVSDLINITAGRTILPVCALAGVTTNQVVYLTNVNTLSFWFQKISTSGIDFQHGNLSELLSPIRTGVYRCRSSPTDISVTQSIRSYDLTIVDRPSVVNFTITSPQSGGYAFVGDNVSAECCVTGYPKPVISIDSTTVTEKTSTLINGVWTVCAERIISATGAAGSNQQFQCSATLSQIVGCSVGSPIPENVVMDCKAALGNQTSMDTSILVAARSCSPALTVVNGNANKNDSNNYQSRATLNCSTGYRVNDSALNFSDCLATGSWSVAALWCSDIDECTPPSNLCRNNGTCNNTDGSYMCMCTSGYVGQDCGTRSRSVCDPNPCKHSGVCTASGTRYSCSCKFSWDGDTCSDLSAGMIVIIIILCILVILGGLFVVWFCGYYRPRKVQSDSSVKHKSQEAVEMLTGSKSTNV